METNKNYPNICFRIGLLLGLMCLFVPYTMVAQSNKVVQVYFDIEGKEVNFSKGVELSFFLDGKEIQPLLYLNGFVVPDFGNAKTVDVCFRYKRKVYRIDALPVNKFETDWTFGIDKKPFKEDNKPQNEKVSMIYFIRFSPKDGSDGTQVIVAITKK